MTTRLKIWTVTNGMAGFEVQVGGVADALKQALTADMAQDIEADIERKQVAPSGLQKLLAPYGSPVLTGDMRAANINSLPDILIASGRQSIPYALKIKRLSKGKCFTVILQNPRRNPALFDFVWAPTHDGLQGENTLSTLLSPHGLTAAKISEKAEKIRPDISHLPTPRLAVILGGPNKVYPFKNNDIEQLAQSLELLADAGYGLLVCGSRRTPEVLLARLKKLPPESCKIWPAPGTPENGTSKNSDNANPYPGLLGLADRIMVTSDSVNMVGEACVTGLPVDVFPLTGGSAKFNRFHRALQDAGLTRAFSLTDGQLPEAGPHPPINSTNTRNSTHEIVAAIRQRLKISL